MHRLKRHSRFDIAGRIVFLLLLATVASTAADPPGTPPDVRRIANFSLVDPQGNNHSLQEWLGRKAVVLFFISTECPISNGYAPEMQRLATKYADQGVACFGIHCDGTAVDVARHAQDFGLTFTMLRDPEQVLARGVGARVTPETVVASPDGKVLYQGRIDDRFAPNGKRRDEPTTFDLENAIQSVLENKTPAVATTKAVGCPLPPARDANR